MTDIIHYAKIGDLAKIKIEIGDKNLEYIENIKDEGERGILHWSVWYGHSEVIIYLIIRGVNLNVQDNYGQTPFLIAVKQRRADIAKLLAKFKADINLADNESMTPLHASAQIKEFNLLKFLIAKNCDINRRNGHGMTPLFLAVIAGDREIVKYLLNKKADVYIRDNSLKIARDYATHKGNKLIEKLFFY